MAKEKLYYIGFKHGTKRGVGNKAKTKEEQKKLIAKLDKRFGKGNHWLVEKKDCD